MYLEWAPADVFQAGNETSTKNAIGIDNTTMFTSGKFCSIFDVANDSHCI